MTKKSVLIHGFFAPSNPINCKKFTLGHQEVLRHHGFEHFQTNEESWHSDNDTYVLLATINKKAVGGLRIVPKKLTSLLPLEKAIIPLDPNIRNYINNLSHLMPSEMCGLWNSKEVAGLHLSHILAKTAFALNPLLGHFCLLSFNASYTFNITKFLGMKIVSEVGKNGYFNYPTPDFKAAVWVSKDMHSFSGIDTLTKDLILSIRSNNHQIHKDFNHKYELTTECNIEI